MKSLPENQNGVERIVFFIEIKTGVSLVLIDDALNASYAVTMSLFIFLCRDQLPAFI